MKPTNAKFPLGQIVSTPAALAAVHPEDLLIAMGRHARGDWGVSVKRSTSSRWAAGQVRFALWKKANEAEDATTRPKHGRSSSPFLRRAA